MFSVKAFAIVSAVLFALGMYGALARRHAVAVLIGIEMMLAAAALNFVSFSRLHPDDAATAGQAFAVFVIAVAAAETVIALALVVALHRSLKTANLDRFSLLKW